MSKTDPPKEIALNTNPLIQRTDMKEDEANDIMELAVTACEKFSTNYEHAARMVKQRLDQRLGSTWQVIVGEAFAFDVEYLMGSLMLMFCSGKIACLVWKSPKE